MPEYSKLIKTPMDLSKVRSKLEVKETSGYKSTEDFVADMRLIFKNCATFHKVCLYFLFDMVFKLVSNIQFSCRIRKRIGSEIFLKCCGTKGNK